ncbi:ATP-binding cassette domain-containing protein [Lactococcus piscium]|uniref:ATP-binding cassette domain-containing protein n=1 Tax=Pseudolactococcus carnosus TaxID=2749961 RepID=UPI0015DBECC9|nr:ATP-binding cassette domain-containing protein [Lactococcus carnosus]MCJ1974675.1 ATP-binding cassette domain-containing protein [Lactococcus carnosus]MCJ1980743.1 ATP-binding cassette domain-containing protein [Lactococcus carnosus]MCJ1984975.1 ATP-binding cassette domain-containing protein [Lactococcus carnosus]MCJ1987916.1 ATP-binding cassette domain-containing protein [Lactococcus carnosus]MCJ1990876.1 ATP-binding cassette domain-containing protein [Lactococcus carnosus]
MKAIKISAQYLTKKFELVPVKSSGNKVRSLIGSNTKNQTDFWALRNVSFTVNEGECVGVIGLNGAGKSTLSNIISGQISQTTGQVEINGDVSIIAANAGMQNNLSGRENIRLKALMVGMSNKEIKAKMDDIIDFSELGPFIDQPVKTYSSGMKAKLGFSIMVHQEPDIMIIDEGLSVGDKTFVDKSKEKMFEFRDQGKTILLVSHDLRTTKEWCDRVIWLNNGEVKAYGTPEEVLPEYEKFTQWFKKLSKKEQDKYKKTQRQAQLDYSVDDLKNEIINSKTNRSRRENQKIVAILKDKKDSHKLSLLSKTIVQLSILCFIWLTLVSLSSVSLGASVKHPVDFLTNRLFKVKKGSQDKENATNNKIKSKLTKSKKSSAQSKPKTSKKKQKSSEDSKTSRSEAKTTYVVQSGDSLSAIAENKGISIDSIKALNPDVDFSIIQPGQEIALPNSVETTTEQSSEGETE